MRHTDVRIQAGVVEYRNDIITAAREWAQWFMAQVPSALNGGYEDWAKVQLRRVAARKEWA